MSIEEAGHDLVCFLRLRQIGRLPVGRNSTTTLPQWISLLRAATCISSTIWKYTGTPLTGWQMLDNNAATKMIAAGTGSFYQIHNTGAIWKYVGPPLTEWQQLDGNAASTRIFTDETHLYQLHKTGLIWRYTG